MKIPDGQFVTDYLDFYDKKKNILICQTEDTKTNFSPFAQMVLERFRNII